MNKRKWYLPQVLLLVAIDQLIKIVITYWFMSTRFDIVGAWIKFHPYLNSKLSYSGHFISIFRNLWVLLFINILLYVLIIAGFLFYQEKREHISKIVKIIIINGFAGNTCSILDKVVWGGSLDFIWIQGLFIFDLKDCYLSICEVLTIILIIIYQKEISFKELLNFCWNKIKRN